MVRKSNKNFISGISFLIFLVGWGEIFGGGLSEIMEPYQLAGIVYLLAGLGFYMPLLVWVNIIFVILVLRGVIGDSDVTLQKHCLQAIIVTYGMLLIVVVGVVVAILVVFVMSPIVLVICFMLDITCYLLVACLTCGLGLIWFPFLFTIGGFFVLVIVIVALSLVILVAFAVMGVGWLVCALLVFLKQKDKDSMFPAIPLFDKAVDWAHEKLTDAKIIA